MRLAVCSLLVAATAIAADPHDRYVTYDGARVHYQTYGSGREAVVFVHGFTCDVTFWSGQSAVYEKRRALLVDLPGHGASDKPEVAYTQERFARAVEAVMRDAGVDRAVLVGHSMGTAVGATFLRLFPAKVRGFVIVDGTIPQPSKDAAEREKQKAQADVMVNRFRGADYKATFEAMLVFMFTTQTPDAMRDSIRKRMLAAPQHVVASTMEGMMSMDPPKPGETFDAPTLAIYVKRPGQPSQESRLRSLFPKLRGYQEWEGAGHFLMMEQPERFNKALEEFLGGL